LLWASVATGPLALAADPPPIPTLPPPPAQAEQPPVIGRPRLVVPAEVPAAWNTTSLESALVEAKRTRRPAMLVVSAVWCGPCKRLEQNVFPRSDFLDVARRFVLVKLDGDKDDGARVRQSHGIQGYPTIVFFAADGREIDRWMGYREPDQFVASMKQIADNPDPASYAAQRARANPQAALGELQRACRAAARGEVEGRELLERLVKMGADLHPDVAARAAWALAAWVLLPRREDAEAERLLRDLVAKYPGTRAARDAAYPLAELLARNGRAKEGVALLEAWTRKASGDPGAYVRFALFALEHDGPFAVAADRLTTALSLWPEDAYLLTLRAQLRARQGAFEAALLDARAAAARPSATEWVRKALRQIEAAAGKAGR